MNEKQGAEAWPDAPYDVPTFYTARNDQVGSLQFMVYRGLVYCRAEEIAVKIFPEATKVEMFQRLLDNFGSESFDEITKDEQQ